MGWLLDAPPEHGPDHRVRPNDQADQLDESGEPHRHKRFGVEIGGYFEGDPPEIAEIEEPKRRPKRFLNGLIEIIHHRHHVEAHADNHLGNEPDREGVANPAGIGVGERCADPGEMDWLEEHQSASDEEPRKSRSNELERANILGGFLENAERDDDR